MSSGVPVLPDAQGCRREYVVPVLAGIALAAKWYAFYILIDCNPFKVPPPLYLVTIPGMVLVPLAFSFLFKGKGRLAYLFLLDCLYSLIILSNLWHIRYFDAPLSISSLRQINDVIAVRRAVLGLARPSDLLLLIDLLLFPAALWRCSRMKADMKAFVLCALGGLAMFLPSRFGIFTVPRYLFPEIKHELRYIFYTPPAYYCCELLSLFRARDAALPGDETAEVAGWLAANRRRIEQHSSAVGPYAGIGRNKNLIVIQVEALDGFVIGRSSGGQEITPVINRLLGHAVYFDNVYSQTAGGSTSDAEFIVNTSLYPLTTRSVSYRYPLRRYRSLPLLLKENGYASVAVHGNAAYIWNRYLLMPALGFDRFISHSTLKDGNRDAGFMGMRDRRVFEKSVKILSSMPRPFFAYFITLDSHFPYSFASEQEKALRLGGKRGTHGVKDLMYFVRSVSSLGDRERSGAMFADYLQSIHQADRDIGGFIDRLRAAGLLEDSLIVLIGDHNAFPRQMIDGIAAMDREGKYAALDLAHYRHRNVPFIVYHPSIKGTVCGTLGGTIDVYPTIAGLMGIDKRAYADDIIGRDLLRSRENYVACAAGGFYEPPSPDSIRVEGNIDPRLVTEGITVSEKIIRGDYFGRREGSRQR